MVQKLKINKFNHSIHQNELLTKKQDTQKPRTIFPILPNTP